MAELATEFSQGPGADKGGELGSLAVSDLLPAMRQALSELKPGQFSPVLEMQGNFVFMQLLERTGQSQIPFAQVRDQIREKLTKEATEAKFKAWMKELRSRTYVKIIE
jgi:peptidyl-prolyl cis-trans isomerase SurA